MKEYFLEMLFVLHRQNKIQKMFDSYVKIFNQIDDEYGSCQLQNKFVLFQLANDNKIFRISASVLLYEIEKLLTAANKKEGISLSCLEAFINNLFSYSCLLEVNSFEKNDIRFILYDNRKDEKSELGYSIKSKLGAPSTLINANKEGTNFIYKIQGISAEQVSVFNSYGNFKKKFAYLESISAVVSYHKTANAILHNNLTLLDLGIERIIAEGLLCYYSGCGRSVLEVTEKITKSDPLNIASGTDQPMYAYKVKQFLLAFALGLTSSTPWYGQFHANGGYIVVKEDGEVVCFHFFDRNDLEEYLYLNTRFETPSTSRHNFGEIYQEEGGYFLKLNLQVRFK